jgi:hypothetical protein
MENLRVYDHYGYALVAVLGTLAAVLIIYRLMCRVSALQQLRGVAPPFINIIGVLFGLTLAFLANDTWSAHDRAMNAVYREADALRSLLVLADMLPSEMKSNWENNLKHYAEAAASEWTQLAARTTNPNVTTQGDNLLRLAADKKLNQEAGAQVQALMLAKVNELRVERDLRIGLSQTHINPLKWLGMAFLGLLTLLSVAAVHIENQRAALVAITLFACSAAPTAAIVLVQGNPFQQPSSVSAKPIQRIFENMGKIELPQRAANI